VLFPSDHPDVWRLVGMWSIWMLTIPAWRAKDVSRRRRDFITKNIYD
jgi:hypothetical protein